MKKRRSVADAIGAIMLIFIIFSASMTLLLATGSYFATSGAINEIKQYESAFNEQNITVRFVQALPPSGQPGLIITNHGTPVVLSYLVGEGSDSSLSFQAVNKLLGHNQTVTILTDNPYSGVLTSFGGLFMANWSPPSGAVPVSLVAVNVALNHQPGLFFVQKGTTLNLHSSHSAKWYVNGTFYHAASDFHVTIEGPTAISAFGD